MNQIGATASARAGAAGSGQGIHISGTLPAGNVIVSAPHGAENQGVPGVTRIVQPANGKFAVVIQGSPDSTRYRESAGILGGKVVYTVYLRVGMRRNWILQYNTPRDETSVIGGDSIEAPWPLVMMRPDQIGAQSTYVLVHGRVTAAGEFDQLSTVFPTDFAEKDLLLKSLKLWKFRPASRDGQAVTVEVLLIIPRQMD